MNLRNIYQIVVGMGLAVLLPLVNQAQINCNAGLTANPQTVVCPNTPVSFNGFLVATTFDFNSGTLPTGWSSSPYTVGQPCIANSPDNSNYFWATFLQPSGTLAGKRFVQTNAVNVAAGGNIVFKMRYGTDDPKNAAVAGCEDPDLIAEGVFLQYSINGGTSFTNINLPNQPNGNPWNQPNASNTGPLYVWTTYSVAIPAAAQTSNVIFRWFQNSNSGTDFDNWGLDDITIQAAPSTTPTYGWTFGDGGTASTSSTTHTYAAPGNYNVSITISYPGCTATASTSVAVLADVTNPTITAAGLNAGPFHTSDDGTGNCTTVANIGTPTANDNCAVSSVVASVSGNPINPATYAFPSGTTTVRWTATDNSGNTAFIDQSVVVLDDENPTITAPPALTVNAGANCSATGVALGTPTVTDNCTTGAPTNNAPATFPLGNTTVTWTVTDGNGNAATATQTVTVIDNEAPVLASVVIPASSVAISQLGRKSTYTNVKINGANNYIVANPGQSLTLTANYAMAFDGGGGCNGCVTQHYVGINGTTVNCHQTLGGSGANTSGSINQSFTAPTFPGIYYITQGATWCYNCGDCSPTYANIPAEALAVVIVRGAPCRPDIAVNTASSTCGAPITYVTPLGFDNCSPITVSQIAGFASGTVFPVGTTLNVFSGTDAANNTGTCTFHVVVTDNEKPVITTNGNQTVNANAGLCSANVTVSASATDNCTVSSPTGVRSDALPLNAPYPVGTTTIIWTVTDANGVAALPVTQTVTVNDAQDPILTAPANININADAGVCYATITNLGTPTASDNCGLLPITSNAPANNQYPVGTNQVEYTVYDIHGNMATATQTIVVTDNQNPTIIPPANLTVDTDPGQCSATNVNLGNAVVSDNCGVLSYSNNAPAVYPKGNTTVTWTVTDVNGRTNTASQTVTVRDNELPLITAPANITTTTSHDGTGNCTTTYNIGFPTVSDNCGIFAIAAAVNGILISPTSYPFPVGTTTVRWEILDNSFNFSFANQLVTVTDDELPTLSGVPANITVSCEANVPVGTPTATDNCTANPTVSYLGQVSTQGSNPLNASYYNYTLTRTWKATDASLNASPVGTQVITVQDVTAPTFTRPANITIYKSATCSFDASPAVTGDVVNESDNCQTTALQATYTDALSAVCVGNLTITRTWHLADASGNAAPDQVQTITVKDNMAPTFTAPPTATIYTTATCTYNASPSVTGDVTNEADNCSTGLQATYTDVVVNGNCAGKKTITRTWHLVDDCGNAAADQVQTINVIDNTAPTFTAPTATTIYASATCSYNADPGITGDVTNEADNCSSGLQATYTDAVVSNTTNGSKVITRTWKLSDNCGNAAPDQTQIITVLDNTPPTLTCAANITACDNFTGNNKTLNLGVTDNCSATTTTWVMSGATSATGSGNSINRNFNVGTSTIVWTVKDGANNTSTCTTTVLIRTAPVATIAASDADAFCNAVELTGNGTPAGAYSYAWSYNNAAFANTQTIRLKVANGDGNYKLVVTDANGCSSQPVYYNLQKQSLAAMYVLIGMREVELAQNNDVYFGSVGVTSSYGDADFDKYCSVASPGAFVKADDINTSSNVNIPNKIYSPAVVTFPTMLLNTSSTSGLSNYTMTTNGTVSGNKKDLTINSGKTVTVTGNVFEDIRINHNATVTFTATDISIKSLELEYGAKIIFASNINIRVKDEVDIAKECSVNPTGKKVTFYVKDPGSSSHNHNCYSHWGNWHGGNHADEKFIVDGRSTNVVANVYMPGGKLRVHGNGHSCNWNNDENCNMVGLFIAEEIEGDGKNINWMSYDCSAPATFRKLAAPGLTQVEEAADYQVLVYPNPTSGQFTIQFANDKEAAEIRILDIQGRLISQRTMTAQEMPSGTFDLTGNSAGAYLIEIRQGETVYHNRIILR